MLYSNGFSQVQGRAPAHDAAARAVAGHHWGCSVSSRGHGVRRVAGRGHVIQGEGGGGSKECFAKVGRPKFDLDCNDFDSIKLLLKFNV